MSTVIDPKYDTLPDKMKSLPIDERGRPVPWFVAWEDGKPEFRAMDPAKYWAALRDRLCWVCGGKRTTYFAFLAGPMCGINHIASEPPSHTECARWSAINCPFLSNPNMVRRHDERINEMSITKGSPGFAILRNPGVAMVWVTREFEIVPDHKGSQLLMMGRPSGVEWYCQGRKATYEEVMESVDSGYNSLLAVARSEGSIPSLERARERFMKWLPKK